jgi:hypothetical protein
MNAGQDETKAISQAAVSAETAVVNHGFPHWLPFPKKFPKSSRGRLIMKSALIRVAGSKAAPTSQIFPGLKLACCRLTPNPSGGISLAVQQPGNNPSHCRLNFAS